MDKSIEIAHRAGLPLKIAAKVDKADLAYYNSKIKRLLKGPGVKFIGEKAKETFMGEAMALLFPIDWPEPFGLVMIKAMANGTPVVAFRRGAVPEIMDHGVTGIVVDNVEEALAMLPQALALDRQEIHGRFEKRFSVERTASDYVALYDEVLRRGTVKARVLTRTADQPTRDAA